MRLPNALVLDLDGIIVDTYSLHISGWISVLSQYGIHATPDELSGYHGTPTENALRQILSDFGIPLCEDELPKLIRMKNGVRDLLIRELDEESVLPGVRQLIHESQAAKASIMCLATTSVAPVILNRLGLLKSFHCITYGADISPPKSQSPSSLIRLLSGKGLDLSSCLFVDDGYAVVARASRAGVPSICVNAKMPPNDACCAYISSLNGVGLEMLYRLAASMPPGVHNNHSAG